MIYVTFCGFIDDLRDVSFEEERPQQLLLPVAHTSRATRLKASRAIKI